MEFEPEKRLGDCGIKSHHFLKGLNGKNLNFALKKALLSLMFLINLMIFKILTRNF
jgi:hypothetical protein